MRNIRAIIVDDESPARKRLRELLEGQPDIKITAECSCGTEAVAMIQKTSPDLMFLDIQMPAMDGFGVLNAIEPKKLPFTIFVTAYDAYAIQAFEVNALDYLLKPFSDERFEIALQRARQIIGSRESHKFNEQLLGLMENYRVLSGDSQQGAQPQPLDRLAIKSRRRVFLLKAEKIDWVEAAGVYVNLHVGGQAHLYRETIGGLERQLSPRRFVRIHRSTIVNLDRISELQPHAHGEYHVLLRDGTRLKLSRTYRVKLQERLGKSF